MKYLVLHRFRSFGKTFNKGDIVDETEVRSPYLRVSEGKITPAVSSQTVPPEFEAPTSPTQEVSNGDDNKQQVAKEPKEEASEEVASDEPKAPAHKPLFNFRK